MDSSDDENLWDKVRKTINPLKDRNEDPFADSPDNTVTQKPFQKNKEDQEKSSKDRKNRVVDTHDSSSKAHKKTDERTPEKARDIDRRTRQKLIRGQFPIEGRLDLHGHSRVEARQALIGFLENSYIQGKRCVIVITGKGRKSHADDDGFINPHGEGILRRNVPNWLYEPPLSNIILSHAPALAKDGGGGAIYVLLRRKRV